MINNSVLEEFREARCNLMLPHPNGEEEAIHKALIKCSFALDNLNMDALGDSQREWVTSLKKFLNTEGLEDPSNKGLLRIKAEALTDLEKTELSRIFDELTNSLYRDYWRSNT